MSLKRKNLKTSSFKQELKGLMDEYVHFVYDVSAEFPGVEKFGVVSQFRRATLSIVLNYIEGFARKRPAVQLNFLEIAYGSLKESKYLLYFSYKRDYLSAESYKKGIEFAERIGAMLWTEISNLERSLKKGA